jgi:hypothetical protein
MDNHEKLLKRIIAARKKPSGEIVRTADGRELFLTKSEVKRATVPTRHHTKLSKLRTLQRRQQQSRPQKVAKKARGCRGVVKWLLSHDPDTEFWRETYVLWVNNC